MENTHPNPTCRLVLMPHVFDSPVLRALQISTLMVSDSCMPLALISGLCVLCSQVSRSLEYAKDVFDTAGTHARYRYIGLQSG